jgi:hypothetical protein
MKVWEDSSVLLVVPNDFNDADVEAILAAKGEWIREHQRYFAAHPSESLDRSPTDLPLFGKHYRLISSAQLGKKVVVDTVNLTVSSGRDLTSNGERTKWLRSFARSHLKERIVYLSGLHKLRFGRLFVLEQRTRWGCLLSVEEHLPELATDLRPSLRCRLRDSPRAAAHRYPQPHTAVLDAALSKMPGCGPCRPVASTKQTRNPSVSRSPCDKDY